MVEEEKSEEAKSRLKKFSGQGCTFRTDASISQSPAHLPLGVVISILIRTLYWLKLQEPRLDLG